MLHYFLSLETKAQVILVIFGLSLVLFIVLLCVLVHTWLTKKQWENPYQSVGRPKE